MEPLLKVENLQMSFFSDAGEVPAVEGVSFTVQPGEVVCIVGESGCGKSATALSVMGLLPKNGRITAGSVHFDGQNLLELDEHALNRIRGNTLTMIFQDAMTSLNPVFTVGAQLVEAIRIHGNMTQKAAYAHAVHMLEQVGLPDAPALMKKYPHTLSGGMRQRVMIAMALCGRPKLLIADEPTTALDVTIQAQIMQLLRNLRGALGLSVLLITHDIGLVAEMADRVLVMYAGQVVEQGDVFGLFREPLHPYTQALLRSVPDIHAADDYRLASVEGRVPEQYYTLKGCRFFDRCPHAQPPCREPQALRTVNDRAVRCRRAPQVRFPEVQEGGRLHA